MTTSTSRTRANPDGLTTAEVFATPVRMQRGGDWIDSDTTLVNRPDGTVAAKVHFSVVTPSEVRLLAMGAKA